MKVDTKLVLTAFINILRIFHDPPAPKQINIVYNLEHYDTITTMKGFLNISYYCLNAMRVMLHSMRNHLITARAIVDFVREKILSKVLIQNGYSGIIAMVSSEMKNAFRPTKLSVHRQIVRSIVWMQVCISFNTCFN